MYREQLLRIGRPRPRRPSVLPGTTPAPAESRSRTADRAARSPADDTTTGVRCLDTSAQGGSVVTRDNVPAPVTTARPVARSAAARNWRRPDPRERPERRSGRRPPPQGPPGGQVPHQPARLPQSPAARATEALAVATAARLDRPVRPLPAARTSTAPNSWARPPRHSIHRGTSQMASGSATPAPLRNMTRSWSL